MKIRCWYRYESKKIKGITLADVDELSNTQILDALEQWLKENRQQWT